jgi:hypothetical protein
MIILEFLVVAVVTMAIFLLSMLIIKQTSPTDIKKDDKHI